MPTLGIVDDRLDQRETLKRVIDFGLRQYADWESIDSSPFPELEEYPAWIAENDISVLILDERLNEEIAPGNAPVEYAGHNLIDFLRTRYQTIPMYVVTTYKDDGELQKRFDSVEDIISRDDFSENNTILLPRMLRAGTKFYEENKAELELLAALARKIATGRASEAEVKQLEGLQLSRMLSLTPMIERSKWLKAFEETADQFEELNARIAEHLQNEVDKNP